MTERRFAVGDAFRIGCFEYRIVRGRKGPDDQALEWRYLGPWEKVVLDHAALHVDAIADNENVLYPYPGKGGAYVFDFVRRALREGWRSATNQLYRERRDKAERLEERRTA